VIEVAKKEFKKVLSISSLGDTCVTTVDLKDCTKGELAHICMELQRLQQKILAKWDIMP